MGKKSWFNFSKHWGLLKPQMLLYKMLTIVF